MLIKQPEIIILDEPTLGIDPEGVREFLELIHRLSRDEGLTVLLSSHHLHQVQQICDRVGLFVKGRLIAAGDIEALSRELFAGEPIAVEMETDAITDRLITSLRAIDDVLSIEPHGKKLVIGCRKDVSPEIARCVISCGAPLLTLTKKEYGLDEIYHRYFEGGNAHEQKSAVEAS